MASHKDAGTKKNRSRERFFRAKNQPKLRPIQLPRDQKVWRMPTANKLESVSVPANVFVADWYPV